MRLRRARPDHDPERTEKLLNRLENLTERLEKAVSELEDNEAPPEPKS